MQQVPKNRTLCTGMSWKTTEQHEKRNYLADMTSEDDEEENEPK